MLTSHTNDTHQITLEVGIGGTLDDKLATFENRNESGTGSYEVIDRTEAATTLRLSGKNDTPHYLVFFPSAPSVEVIARETCRTCNNHTMICYTYEHDNAGDRVIDLAQWIADCIGDDVCAYDNN